jgi:uncharacterized protein
MTPQEQQLVADLFDRLASLEGQRRDPDAERLIREGLGRAPNAVYALVQSVLVQDEALKRANGRIEELERTIATPAGGGFLDNMRNSILGRDQPRASVPSVRAGGMGSSGVWGSGPGTSQPQGNPQGNPQAYPQAYPPGYPPGGYPTGAPMGGGGSFLGTAAATVAGVVGGAMLLDGIRSMMGPHHSFAGDADHNTGGVAHAASSPWDSGGDHAGGNLARDAGLDDIGGGHRAAAYDNASGSGGGDDAGDETDAGDEAYEQPDDDYDVGDDGGDMGGGDYDTA